jgi:hypothetical protein
VVPKSGSEAHLRENIEGLFSWRLTWDQKVGSGSRGGQWGAVWASPGCVVAGRGCCEVLRAARWLGVVLVVHALPCLELHYCFPAFPAARAFPVARASKLVHLLPTLLPRRRSWMPWTAGAASWTPAGTPGTTQRRGAHSSPAACCDGHHFNTAAAAAAACAAPAATGRSWRGLCVQPSHVRAELSSP